MDRFPFLSQKRERGSLVEFLEINFTVLQGIPYYWVPLEFLTLRLGHAESPATHQLQFRLSHLGTLSHGFCLWVSALVSHDFLNLSISAVFLLVRTDWWLLSSMHNVWITINCGKFWKRWEYQTTLRNLYAGQETTVRTEHGTTDWFHIGKGVRQDLEYCFSNFDVHKNHLRILFNLITMAEAGEFTNH